jgi:phosphatidylglycerophosphatase C
MSGRDGGSGDTAPQRPEDGIVERRPVAAFDLDGTLTRRDTLMPFLRRAVGRQRAYRAILASSLPLARAAALGGAHRDRAKAAFLRGVLAGVPREALAEAAESYADHVVIHGLRPDVRARVEWHREQGHELVLVSASPEIYVTPIGRRLGFDEVLATRLEVDPADRLTGRLVGANCRGPEKVARLREWRGDDLAVAYAYGDSAGDREMLALAARAVLRPRPRPRVVAVPVFHARTLANALIEEVPSVYCSVMRRRHPEWPLVGPETDVVIEGYQSSGNTFARKAMAHANPHIRIASHSHSWAHVAHGLRLGKPVVVLLRNPLDAVASHAVRMRLEDLDRELRRYRYYYRRVSRLSESVVLAPFDVTTTRFSDVISQVNARFNTRFNLFDDDDPVAVAKVFEEMEQDAFSEPAELDSRIWSIARPSAERAEATREMRAQLTSEQLRPALARCEAVYEELLRASTLR